VSARWTRSANERSPRRGSTPSATGSARRCAAIRNDEHADVVELAAAITDLIAALQGGLPAAIVAVLLVR
jgi:hypothetical protein